MQRTEILIVEDDQKLVELLTWHMAREGFAVRVAVDGEQALGFALDAPPDLMLLDWMIPGVSGIEVCRRLRRHQSTAKLPIIMLTARSEEADRVRGLEGGADDYVTKPFSPRELVARVHAVLRRVRPALADVTLNYADLVMDVSNFKVRRGKSLIALGPTEFRLLRHFMEHPGRVFSRELLVDAVWGYQSEVEPRTVDVHIRRLRKALNESSAKDLIRTVRSGGYALDEEN